MKLFTYCPFCKNKLLDMQSFSMFYRCRICPNKLSKDIYYFHQEYNVDEKIDKLFFSTDLYKVNIYSIISNGIIIRSYLDNSLLFERVFEQKLFWEPDFSNIKSLNQRIENILLLA